MYGLLCKICAYDNCGGFDYYWNLTVLDSERRQCHHIKHTWFKHIFIVAWFDKVLWNYKCYFIPSPHALGENLKRLASQAVPDKTPV